MSRLRLGCKDLKRCLRVIRLVRFKSNGRKDYIGDLIKNNICFIDVKEIIFFIVIIDHLTDYDDIKTVSLLYSCSFAQDSSELDEYFYVVV